MSKKEKKIEEPVSELIKREVSYGELYALADVLPKILQFKLPIGKWVRIKGLLGNFKNDIEIVKEGQRNIIIKYALKDNEGKPIETNGMISPDPKNQAKVNKEMMELFAVKKELTYFPIDLTNAMEEVFNEETGRMKLQPISMTLIDLENLTPFLSDKYLKTLE